MKARVTWTDSKRPDSKRRRARSGRTALRALEWMFLLVGLLAVDCFVWVNTSGVLYQAYQDWAFDQTLRGLTPTIGGFIGDETHWLLGREQKVEKAEAPPAPVPKGAPPVAIAPPAPRSVIGRLEIPRLKLAVMVREGADEGTLSRAVGHIPGTALPGAIGNVGLAGHRDTFFRKLRSIHADDVIELQTTAGTYRYLVKSTKIVTPRDVSVLKASGGETLTLVTCYPFYYVGSAPKRFIVHAAQIAATPQHPPQPNS
ncbi:MAG TPA: class D sortase [Bryobacteraceae bacterium]|nr:class D sortase [Bryobacteraceae bacterium]